MSTTRLIPYARALRSLLLTALLVAPATGFAQDGTGLSIETFQPSSSSGAFFELVLPRVKDNLKWHIGGLVHYSHEPARRQVFSATNGALIEEAFPLGHRVAADLFASMGLFGFGEIGLALPVIAFQDGEGGTPNGAIQSAGLGDPRLDLKARFFDANGFGLGLGTTVTAPVGHYASTGSDLMGSKTPTVQPKLLGSFEGGKFTAAVNVGFLFREGQTLGGYEQSHALTWNAGLAYDIKEFYYPKGLRIAIEANSEVGSNFDSIVETPIEVLAGVKYRTKKHMVISVGGGPGATTAVGAPVFRVFAGLAWDPFPYTHCAGGPEDMDGFEDNDDCLDPDNDMDTILDEVDECPNEAEDFDKFDDEDGCPDRDNDGDKVFDTIDRCPMISEDFDDFEDDDGCPEEGPAKPQVKITDTQILISSKIYFDFDKDTIKDVSHPILDAVADELNKNLGIKKVRIDGHTDNEGTDSYNQSLSELRAKSVMEYLIGKNVDPKRLTYEGFGFSKPKASNKTEEGKAINRRVEFTILEKD